MILAAVLDSGVLIALAVVLCIAGVGFGIAVSYRYRLAYYLLLDDPDMGSLEAISRSKQAMRGWKGSLFVLDLSFLGWILLTPFTLGILGLWLNPYMGAAEANFYDYVVHGAFGPQTAEAVNFLAMMEEVLISNQPFSANLWKSRRWATSSGAISSAILVICS